MKRISGFSEWSGKLEEKDCGCNEEKITEKNDDSDDSFYSSLDSLAGIKKSLKKNGVEKTVDMLANGSKEINDQIIEKYISSDIRKDMAEKGYALPDGSFPIENVSDLKKAIKAYGRAKNQTAAAKHIAKRAKDLGKSHLLPHTEDFQKSLKS